MAVSAHDHAYFIFSQRHPLWSFGLNSDVAALLRAIDFAIRQGGNISKGVLRLAQGAANLFGNTYDCVWLIVEINGFAQRINSEEETLYQIHANESYFSAMLVIGIADVPALRHLSRIKLRHGAGDSPNEHILQIQVL